MKGFERKPVLISVGVALLAGLAIVGFMMVTAVGNVKNVAIHMDETETYTTQEIQAAMDVVMEHFHKEYAHCTLLTLSYKEMISRLEGPSRAETYGASQAIVLISDFSVQPGADRQFQAGTEENGWEWTLVREPGEAWRLVSWGY